MDVVILTKALVHLLPVGLIAILLVNLCLLVIGSLGLGWLGQTVTAIVVCPIVMLVLTFSGIAPSDLTQAKYPDLRDMVSPFVAAFIAAFVGGSTQVLLLSICKGSKSSGRIPY